MMIIVAPLQSSTVTLSPPDSTMSSNTIGIQWNTFCIVTAGKFSQASLTVAASPSGSHLWLWCLTSTTAWTLNKMPRSKAFTSGEHTDCCNIIILNSSLNLLVYSSLTTHVLWPPVLSITQVTSFSTTAPWGRRQESSTKFMVRSCSFPSCWWFFFLYCLSSPNS
jgi:hypothetical protein